MYNLIYTAEHFEYESKLLSKHPFVLDDYGIPFDIVNDYFLYLSNVKRRDGSSTIPEAARHITSVLNKLLVDIEKNKGISWDRVTTAILKTILNQIERFGTAKKEDVKNSTANSYLSDFIAFLWWAEHVAGVCSGVVGFNDIGNDKRYRVGLSPSNQRFNRYKIPWLLKSARTNLTPRGDSAAWERALEQTRNLNDVDAEDYTQLAKKHRDEIIVRLIKETSLRRCELVSLEVSQFDSKFCSREGRVFITLNATKGMGKETRQVGIDAGGVIPLWQAIQDFIQFSRPSLTEGKKKCDVLLPSLKTGQSLKAGSVNSILKLYGVKPHEGRKVGLTHYMIDCINMGHSQDEAILLASQHAGHSSRGQGAVFLNHYLLAKEYVSRSKVQEADGVKEENELLKLQLSQAAAELDRLREQIEKDSAC